MLYHLRSFKFINLAYRLVETSTIRLPQTSVYPHSPPGLFFSYSSLSSSLHPSFLYMNIVIGGGGGGPTNCPVHQLSHRGAERSSQDAGDH